MDFLMERRFRLDENEDLFETIEFLQEERLAKRSATPAPKLPKGFDFEKLRELPAFLEPIGTFLEYNPATFHKAYGFFSEEVLLCAESEKLWQNSNRAPDDYKTSVFWRSFATFANATQRRYGPRQYGLRGVLQRFLPF